MQSAWLILQPSTSGGSGAINIAVQQLHNSLYPFKIPHQQEIGPAHAIEFLSMAPIRAMLRTLVEQMRLGDGASILSLAVRRA